MEAGLGESFTFHGNQSAGAEIPTEVSRLNSPFSISSQSFSTGQNTGENSFREDDGLLAESFGGFGPSGWRAAETAAHITAAWK